MFEQIRGKYHNFSSENFHFYSHEKKLHYITWACFRNEKSLFINSYDKMNMKVFASSLFEKISWGLTYFDQFQ